MKQTLRFDQISCRLEVEGLPDVSTGQGGDGVGIITGWSLQWTGRPALEGKKEHLLALMQAVLPYARLLVSAADRAISSAGGEVEIAAAEGGGHQLLLRSSQPNTEPLTVVLDDAELSDLVRVLDRLRLERRLLINLDIPDDRPLRGREVSHRVPRRQRLAAPAAAVLALALSTTASLLWPTPKAPLPSTPVPARAGEPIPTR